MVAMDKLKDTTLHHHHNRLGLGVEIRNMTMSIPDPYINEVIHIIASKWHHGRKAVTVSELMQHGGKMGHITHPGCAFLFFLSQIYVYITCMLERNTHHLKQTDSVLNKAITKSKEEPNIGDGQVKHHVLYSKMISACLPH